MSQAEDRTHAAGAPVERPVRPLPQRWTGIVQAHANGGFVAVGDYMAAVNELERLRGIVPEVLERLNDELCAENERLCADATALRELLNNSQTAVCVANRTLVLDGLPGKIAEALARTAYLKA